MKKFVFKLLFTSSSFSGILIFLLISKNINVPFIDISFLIRDNLYLKYSIIFFLAIVFARAVLYLSGKLLEKADNFAVDEIKPVEGIFLPVYIGLFVIALELGDHLSIETFFLIFFLFILWFFFEGVSYFNPFFLFFGYRFYEVKSDNKLTFMLITKRKDLKRIERFDSLIRINNFTFLEYDTLK